MKNKKLIALIAAGLIALAGIGYLARKSTLELPTVAPAPIVDDVDVPPPTTQTPSIHWGPCGTRQLAHFWEEDALRRVLASRVKNDPLFGTNVMSMEAAECAAYRWRLEGR